MIGNLAVMFVSLYPFALAVAFAVVAVFIAKKITKVITRKKRKSVHQQQAHDDMQAMDELYNKLLLDEILK